MKRIIKFSSLFLAFVFMTATQLNAKMKPVINISNDNKLIVELNDWKTSELKLEILDENGEIVYSDHFQGGLTTQKEYELEKLKVGSYFLILHGSNYRSVKAIKVDFDSIEFVHDENKATFSPKVSFSKKSIDLDYMAFGEDVKITIFGNRGVVYSAYLEGKISIQEHINIKNFQKGSYVFQLDSETHHITRGFRK